MNRKVKFVFADFFRKCEQTIADFSYLLNFSARTPFYNFWKNISSFAVLFSALELIRTVRDQYVTYFTSNLVQNLTNLALAPKRNCKWIENC